MPNLLEPKASIAVLLGPSLQIVCLETCLSCLQTLTVHVCVCVYMFLPLISIFGILLMKTTFVVPRSTRTKC